MTLTAFFYRLQLWFGYLIFFDSMHGVDSSRNEQSRDKACILSYSPSDG